MKTGINLIAGSLIIEDNKVLVNYVSEFSTKSNNEKACSY
jgi:hypothetical protein